jgi:ABC-type transport system involved in Fe-S cluster assembly fused permease/ATPase subunit
VNVQASLSFLNITQKFILQVCLALSLSLATVGIRQRIDCCMAQGCDSGISECCQAIDKQTCPGMDVGDFVAVFTYTIQLFQPLNFLGTVYNAIVMAIVDLTNLSQLLAQNPDIQDTPDAMILPQTNEEDEDIAVEFDNVYFHYPTQPASKGLKGVSFKMRRGTTTAIVGPTGKFMYYLDVFLSFKFSFVDLILLNFFNDFVQQEPEKRRFLDSSFGFTMCWVEP